MLGECVPLIQRMRAIAGQNRETPQFLVSIATAASKHQRTVQCIVARIAPAGREVRVCARNPPDLHNQDCFLQMGSAHPTPRCTPLRNLFPKPPQLRDELKIVPYR